MKIHVRQVVKDVTTEDIIDMWHRNQAIRMAAQREVDKT